MGNRIVPRRVFLLAGAAAVPALGALASRAGQGAAVEALLAGVPDAQGACRLTETGQYGPFYREGAPWRTRLCGPDEPGRPLTVAGRVTAAGAGCEPLKDAVVDVWQANAAGFYDNNDPARPFDPARYNLRGRVRTDAEGRYRFETVLPGNYGQGRFTRAKHIHVLVTCGGREPLITEIYFEGDRHNDTDTLVRRSLITRLSGADGAGGGPSRVTFDIALAAAR